MITYDHEMQQYVAEASTLGWAPGYWPLEFHADSIKFVRTDITTDMSVTYLSDPGAKVLVVFND